MICDGCRRGDHCGLPGVPGPCGVCQHMPPGAWAGRRTNGCPYCTASVNPDMRDHVRNVHPDRFAEWEAIDWDGTTAERISRAQMDGPPLVITTDDVKIMADAVARVAELIDDCQDTDTCCPGNACRLDDARRLAPLSAPGGVLVDPEPGTDAAPPRTADERAFSVVLTEWMRHRRAGRFREAAALRKIMISRLGRTR